MTDAPSPESPSEASRLLAADHAELDALLRELRAELDAGEAARAFERLNLFWARLGVHIRAEHLHLFPAILDATDEARRGEHPPAAHVEARDHLARLRADHDFFMHELARAVKAMREILPASGGTRAPEVLREVGRIVRAVEERLAAHNSLEEGLVYRLPAALLPEPERAALAERVGRELANLPRRVFLTRRD